MDATLELTPVRCASERTPNVYHRLLHPSRAWCLGGLMLITLLGAGLRWSFLDHPMRYDEALNYYQFTSRSPEYILTHYNPGNHVLHTIMVRVSTELFGRTPLGLRFPVFVGGTLLIPVTAFGVWLMTRDRWAGLLSALAIAGSGQLVEYSTNARGYVWLALMTMLATIAVMLALRAPTRTRRWLCWGAIAGLGAYTMPLMIYPVAGMGLAGCVIALRRGPRSVRGRATIRGLLIGGFVCGLTTFALYLPILLTMGPAEVWGIQQMTLDVWGPRVGGFTNQLQLVWKAWTPDSGWWWAGLLIIGALAYLVRIARRPTSLRLLPIVMLIGAVIAVRVHDAPLRSRAWMFAMPIFVGIAMAGLSGLWRRARFVQQMRPVPLLAIIAIGVVLVANFQAVAARTYLCSEPDVQVNVAEVIKECQSFGTERCALVMRYTPAANFYRDLWNVESPQPADAPQTERVYIVTDHVDALGDLWNSQATGFAHFAEPKLLRTLSHCTIYVADRIED